MKNFDWEEFKTGSVAVHCDTEEKANDFIKQALEHGLKWLGLNYLTDNSYSDRGKSTCYRAGVGSDIFHASLQFYCELDKKIIEWEINEMKEFTENDLKVGMLVETKHYGKCGYGLIIPSRYDGTAIIYKNGEWDYINLNIITKVWGYCEKAFEALNFDPDDRELLYQCKEPEEPKKMTVKEICELVGFDVEIVKE